MTTSAVVEINFTTKDSSNTVGNFLKATEDLSFGQVVLSEAPCLVGPNHVTEAVCLECLKTSVSNECPRCHWTLCLDCSSLKTELIWHSKAECARLLHNQDKIYEAVLPLRLVNEALAQSDAWQRLRTLQDHCEKKVESEEWRVFHEKVIPFIRRLFDDDKVVPSSDLILKCIGIICVNAVGIDRRGKRGRALYATASLASHSCLRNTIHRIDANDLWIHFKACKPIKQGEEITISYVPLIIGEPLRSEHIRSEWCFECQCARCLDDKIDEDLSQLTCSLCKQGSLLYTKLSQSWKCNYCSLETSEKTVKASVEKAEKELKTIMKASDVTNEILEFDDQILGPNHFLRLIGIRHWMTRNKSGDICGEDRLHFSQKLLKLVQRIGGHYWDWPEFLFRDLAFNALEKATKSEKKEDKLIYIAMAKAYSRESQRCQQLMH